MYCSKCGKHIGDHDKFCSGCGSRVPEPPEETEASSRMRDGEAAPAEPYTLDTSEFVWDVHEFHTRVQRPEDVRVDWERGTVTEIGKESGTEFVKEPKERPVANPETETERPGAAEEFRPVTLDDIESDLLEGGGREGQPINKEMRRDTARLEKFYTFNQKNEEFQKLLDREYERIRRGRGEEPVEESMVLPEEISAEEPLPENIEPEKNTEEGTEAAPPAGKETPELDIFDNTEIIKRFDTMELEKDVLAEPEKKEQPIGFSSAVLDELFGKKIADSLGEGAEEIVKENIENAANTEEVSEGAPGSASAEAVRIAEMEEPENEEADTESSEVKEPEDFVLEEPEIAETPGEIAEAPGKRDTEAGIDGTEAETAEEGRKGKILSAVLTIIIIILLAELAILGIRYLAPDSKAAAFISDKTAKFSEMLFSKGQKDTEDESEQDKTKTENPQTPNASSDTLNEAIDLMPAEDKIGILMEAAAACNQNITAITADPDLKYDSSARYSNKKIYDTVPLEDNILSDGSSGVSYVDREAVKTLIAFDSGWIDYVNDGNDAIFHSVLKEGSTAYKNCAAFRKKVKKSFESLAIGEIRKDEKGYYVWSHEVIQTTSGSKTTTDEYNWVYYMEPQEGKLLIVDYYKF